MYTWFLIWNLAMHINPLPTTDGPASKPSATLRDSPLGWVIDLLDSQGKPILSSAAYGSKFLAEEALAKMHARDAAR